MYNFICNEFNPFISGMMVFFDKPILQKMIKNNDNQTIKEYNEHKQIVSNYYETH